MVLLSIVIINEPECSVRFTCATFAVFYRHLAMEMKMKMEMVASVNIKYPQM